MKKLVYTLLFAYVTLSYAYALDLHEGDVLLISFNCYECRVIESETNSKFSHSGVVIKDENHEIRIGQSLGSVALYPLDQFLKNKTPGTDVAVYRPRDFFYLSATESVSLEERMLNVFNTTYKGAAFNEKYLWNDYDDQGKERYYCAEFIAKFLDHFLSTPTIPQPMTFKKNEAYWNQYFHGNIPEGELGISPASFTYDDRFTFVGNL